MEQRLCGHLDLADIAALAPFQRRLFQQARQADDGVHRRADFMAHVGDEFALGDTGRLGLVACAHQLLVEFMQAQFRALEFRDVRGQHEEAAHAAAVVDIGDVIGPRVAHLARGIEQVALEALRPARQHAVDMVGIHVEQFLPQQFAHVDAGQFGAAAAKPFVIEFICEAATQIGAPVRHHAGQVVGDGADEALVLFQAPGGGVQHLGGAPAFRDIDRHPQHVAGAPRIVAQDHLARGEVARGAVGRIDRFLFDFHHLPRGQQLAVGADEGGRLLRREEVVVGLAQQLLARASQGQFRVAVDHFKAQLVGALDEDHGRDVFDDGAEQMFRVAKFRFAAPALADVQPQARHAQQLLFRAENRVIRDDPVTQLFALPAAVAVQFHVDDGHARRQHLAHAALHVRAHGVVAQHGAHGTAQMLRHAGAVDGGQVVVDHDDAQVQTHEQHADRHRRVHRFQQARGFFQGQRAFGHQAFKLRAVAPQVAFQRAQGAGHVGRFAVRVLVREQGFALRQRLDLQSQFLQGAGQAAAHAPGQGKAGTQQQGQDDGTRDYRAQQRFGHRAGAHGDSDRPAVVGSAAKARIHVDAFQGGMAQHAFACLAYLFQQGRRAALAHVALRRHRARHVDAVGIDEDRVQVGRQAQLAQQHGQVVGRVQRRQHMGSTLGTRQGQVQRQPRHLVRRHEQAGQPRLAVLARAFHAGGPFLRQGGRCLAGGQGRIDQLASPGVGDDEGADGQAWLQQAVGQGAQGADVVRLQGGRGGEDARGHLGAVQVAFDGGGDCPRRLRRFADDMLAFARVALRHEQQKHERRRHDPGEHQP